MTEKEFQSRVIYEAELTGWRVYHTYSSRRSEPGFPDMTMVRGDRLIFAELKSARGNLSRKQREWLDALRATAAEVYLWYPRDTDQILEVLA